ncbi:hypothetical protein SNEBB_001659 [Seison nebaliae]|nr:hypothetical protein SNEBB_001659 [Seison nebaliae]
MEINKLLVSKEYIEKQSNKFLETENFNFRSVKLIDIVPMILKLSNEYFPMESIGKLSGECDLKEQLAELCKSDVAKKISEEFHNCGFHFDLDKNDFNLFDQFSSSRLRVMRIFVFLQVQKEMSLEYYERYKSLLTIEDDLNPQEKLERMQKKEEELQIKLDEKEEKLKKLQSIWNQRKMNQKLMEDDLGNVKNLSDNLTENVRELEELIGERNGIYRNKLHEINSDDREGKMEELDNRLSQLYDDNSKENNELDGLIISVYNQLRSDEKNSKTFHKLLGILDELVNGKNIVPDEETKQELMVKLSNFFDILMGDDYENNHKEIYMKTVELKKEKEIRKELNRKKQSEQSEIENEFKNELNEYDNLLIELEKL